MTVTITPVALVRSEASSAVVTAPPDKSILHRALMIGALTRSSIRLLLPEGKESVSMDVIATLLALTALGVPVEMLDDHIQLQGVGRLGLRAPSHVINCANSGTTARFLMGLLAGQPFEATLCGDDSLRRRPMQRVADMLNVMGARIDCTEAGTLPAKLHGRADGSGSLRGSDISLRVASAQMKSAALLAGLFAESPTTVREPTQSRDHTERMLRAFGFNCTVGSAITIDPLAEPKAIPDEFDYIVPGDVSSAAFLIALAILLKRRVLIKSVGLNPTRTRFLDILALMGAEIESRDIREEFGEPIGDLMVYGDRSPILEAFSLAREDVPLLIDELPILSVLAVFAHGESQFRGAAELRIKESDRLRLVAEQLRRFGVDIDEFEDGLNIGGLPDRRLQQCAIEHGGDHRLAMSFSIAALFCPWPVEIPEAEVVAVSYPGFYTHMRTICGPGHVEILTQ